MPLEFTREQIVNKFEHFVSEFLKEEENVERKEYLPRLWLINVPGKEFEATIECKCIGKWHGIEQWCAIVTEANGNESNFLLFEDEIQSWAKEQRRLKGIV